ncbi:MAG: hypothetical protein LBG65_04350 [Puniceicoccales bacterium]|nr:hypothetical protein [Puniceicoccales bacterium]
MDTNTAEKSFENLDVSGSGESGTEGGSGAVGKSLSPDTAGGADAATAQQKALQLAAAVRDIAACFGTQTVEARNALVSKALVSLGTALTMFGVQGVQPWLTAAGVVIGVVPTAWVLWDNWRAGRAVARAVESGAAKAFLANEDAVQAARASDRAGSTISPARVAESDTGGKVFPVVVSALGVGGILFSGALAFCGCAHHAPLASGNPARLKTHPEFVAAAQAAPGWVLESLNTVWLLENDARDAAPFGVDYSHAAPSAQEWAARNLAPATDAAPAPDTLSADRQATTAGR